MMLLLLLMLLMLLVSTCSWHVAVSVTASERSDVSAVARVVALAIEAVGLQTGALAVGGLMTTIFGHRELDVFDMPFDTFTLILTDTSHQ